MDIPKGMNSWHEDYAFSYRALKNGGVFILYKIAFWVDVLYISSASCTLFRPLKRMGPVIPICFSEFLMGCRGSSIFVMTKARPVLFFQLCELFSTRSDHPINKPGCYSELSSALEKPLSHKPAQNLSRSLQKPSFYIKSLFPVKWVVFRVAGQH